MLFFLPCCHQNCGQSLLRFLDEFPENLWRPVKKGERKIHHLNTAHNTRILQHAHLCIIQINVPGFCSAGMYPILQLWHLNKHRGASVSNFTDTFPVKFAVWGEIRETENISNGPLSCLTDDGQNKQNVWGGSQKKWWGWERIRPSRTNMQRPG